MSNYHQKLDQELSLKGIIIFVVGLTVIVALSFAGLWAGSLALRNWEKAQDPPAPVLEEARLAYEPPAPRLQGNPFEDIEELRAHEEAVLGTYDWADEEHTMVRVPIERAIELVASGELSLIPAGQSAAEAVEVTASSEAVE